MHKVAQTFKKTKDKICFVSLDEVDEYFALHALQYLICHQVALLKLETDLPDHILCFQPKNFDGKSFSTHSSLK